MKKVSLLILVCFFVSMFMIVGCTLTASDSITRTYYYYPDWTPAGQIVCSKNIQTSSTGPGPTPGTEISGEYYIAVMDDNGSNEAHVKRISNSAKVAASPLGNYYAYAEIGSNFLNVIDLSGNNVISIDCGAQVDSLDWSPDENKLVYGTKTSATSEIYTININGSSKQLLTNGENVAWRYGNKIAFLYIEGINSRFATILSDGTSRYNFSQGEGVGTPQISHLNNSIIFGKSGTDYLKMDISNLNSLIYTTLITSFNGYLPKINRNEDKLTYTNYSSAGIWIINISGNGEVQLR